MSLIKIKSPKSNCAMVLARSANKVIGYKGQIPWDCPEDMEHFKTLTSGHTCISGYKTYLTLPEYGLPNRKLYVLTSKLLENKPNIFFIKNLAEFFGQYFNSNIQIFCIGGLQIYKEFLPYTSKIYLTEIKASFEGDVFFNDELLRNFKPELIRETKLCKYFLYSRHNRGIGH